MGACKVDCGNFLFIPLHYCIQSGMDAYKVDCGNFLFIPLHYCIQRGMGAYKVDCGNFLFIPLHYCIQSGMGAYKVDCGNFLFIPLHYCIQSGQTCQIFDHSAMAWPERTTNGDYCIKECFSTITSLFILGTSPKGENSLPLANSFL